MSEFYQLQVREASLVRLEQGVFSVDEFEDVLPYVLVTDIFKTLFCTLSVKEFVYIKKYVCL